MRSRFARRPSPALAISLLALFVALGGSGYAAVKIHGKNIQDGTVAGKKLKNRTLGTKKLSKATVKALKGAKGDKGDPGSAGATGPAGSPTASMITGATAFNLGLGATSLSPSGVSSTDTLGVRQLSPSSTIVARDLAFRVETAPTGSQSALIYLEADEVATPLTCTIDAGATSCNSGSATATIAPASSLTIVASTNASLGHVSWAFQARSP